MTRYCSSEEEEGIEAVSVVEVLPAFYYSD